MADLRICFSCRLNLHLLRNLVLKFTFKNYEVKIELSDIKSGNYLRNINQIALIFGTLTHNNILHRFL